MLSGLPFVAYDFFGYLASGFLFLVAVDHVAGTRQLSTRDAPVLLTLLGLLVTYITGQLLANLSAFVLERGVVQGLLGDPARVILA